jgi:hypothetical protein
MWPIWARSNYMGAWTQTERWQQLIQNPVASGANPVNYLGSYSPETKKIRELEHVVATLKEISQKVIMIENPVPSFFADGYGGGAFSSRPFAQAIASNASVPYHHRSLKEWGLNDGHFFGSRNYPVHKIDWFHLNFPGSYIFSKEMGKILAREL